MRQKHLAAAEELSDPVHSVHQGAFYYIERSFSLQTSFFHILFNEVENAFGEGVRKPLLNRARSPCRVLALLLVFAFQGCRQLNQSVCRVFPAVEQHIFHSLANVLGNIVVYGQLSGVHDAHVHSCVYCVVEERRMHRFTHPIVAPERERDVADPTAHQSVRERCLDSAACFQVREGIPVVLLNARGYRKDVGIEEDIFLRESDLFGENSVRPCTDIDFPFRRVCLPLFIKCHHDYCRTVPADQPGLFDERRFALLQTDRIHHSFALQAFQAGFNH